MTSTHRTTSSEIQDLYDDGEYKRPVPRSKQVNCLLVRRPVGKVKPTTYALPPEDFCYGKVDKAQDNGNILLWTVPEKPQRGSSASQKAPYSENTVFGRPSPPAAPLTNVICNQYQREWIAEQRKQQAVVLAQSSRGSSAAGAENAKSISGPGITLRPPRSTAASLGHTKPRDQGDASPLFKMKRFQNVPSRVRLGNLPLAQAGSAIMGQISSATSFDNQVENM